MGSFGLKGILIFDSNPNHARDYPTKSNLSHLEIAHAPIHLEGDLYILEYLSTLKNTNRYRLVTSDRALAHAAKNLKITSIDSKDFYSLLSELSDKQKTIKADRKPTADTKREFERLLHIFESKLE